MTSMRAVQITQYGGTEKLLVGSVAMPEPKQGEIRVKIAFAGVNFMDIYTRRGVYKGTSPYSSELPLTLGMEGSGWVEAIGAGVKGFSVGDRVVFCLSRGSYADYAVVSMTKLILLPDGISLETAATGFFQGLTAHYLAYETSHLQSGDICLVYSAAGGVAQSLIQLLRHRQIDVIASANSIAKCSAAARAGANQVVLDSPASIQDMVGNHTNNQGVAVVFDSVGAPLFETSLKVLKTKGLFIHYGANAGPLGQVDPMQLANAGSLYFVRPRLNDHISSRSELVDRAQQLFKLWKTFEIGPRPQHIYDLCDVSVSHQALENRQSIGKSILRITK